MTDPAKAAPMREEKCTYCKGYGYVIMAPSTTSLGGKEPCPNCTGVKAQIVFPAAPMRDDVTQADREAAAKVHERSCYEIVRIQGSQVRRGYGDTDPLVLDFARHRLAHTARPDAGDEDVERVARAAGQAVLDGTGNGTYDEAQDAIRLLIAAMREGVDWGMVERLRTELAWYGEQARLARLIHKEGDAGRNALAEDGGKRAAAALSPEQPR